MEEKKYPLGNKEIKWTSTNWLADHLDDDFMILDVQPDIHDYIKAHIPGAVYMSEKLLRVSEKGMPGKWIPEEAAAAIFGRLGLEPDIPVIVYTGTGLFKGWGDGLEQTMVAYTLKRFGHKNIYILDGGLDKWLEEDRKITKEFPKIEGSSFNAQVKQDLFLTYEQFLEEKDEEDTILLDARPEDVYQDQGPWIKPGHIPGAINLPWKSLMREDNTRLLKSEKEIQDKLASMGISKDNNIICSCGTGREATNEYVLFKHFLNYPSVKLYEGSFTEWSSFPDNPTVTGKDPR